jgi:predicted RNA binding protein YcfA (HicA-like mRNA interferase family)
VNRSRLMRRLLRGSLTNVPFADFVNLVEGFGFQFDRVAGSHHIYRHPVIRQRINIQAMHGEAKPYQIRQFLRLVEQYHLRLEDERE